MKKVLAILILLSHMNTSMFLPQIPELDAFDHNGKKQDDINSVLEFIGVTLDLDNTADDEDDDTGQAFNMAKAVEYDFCQPVYILREKKSPESKPIHFAEYRSHKIKDISIDILTPPPELRHLS